jgi:hypothetical protein
MEKTQELKQCPYCDQKVDIISDIDAEYCFKCGKKNLKQVLAERKRKDRAFTKWIFGLFIAFIVYQLFLAPRSNNDSSSVNKPAPESNKSIELQESPKATEISESSKSVPPTIPESSENNAEEIIIESNKTSIDDIVTIAKQKFEKYIPNIQASRDGEVNDWKATVGDFTGDGEDDIAIEFTVTSSGTDEIKHQGIAFYRNTGNDAQVITGFDPPYQFSIEKISNGQIYITQRVCCPAEKIPKIITLEGRRVSVSTVQ